MNDEVALDSSEDIHLRLAEIGEERSLFAQEMRSLEGATATTAVRRDYVGRRMAELTAEGQRLSAARGDDLNGMLDEFLRHLPEGDLKVLQRLFAPLAARPLWLREKLRTIRDAAATSNSHAMLFDLFRGDVPGASRHLALVVQTVQFGMAAGMRDKALQWLGRTNRKAVQRPVRFGVDDYVSTLCGRAGLDRSLRLTLRTLKYRALHSTEGLDPFVAAEHLADHVDFPTSTARHLYEHRYDASPTLGDWRRNLAFAHGLAHVVTERPRRMADDPPSDFTDFVNDGEWRAGLRELGDRGQGALLVTCHSGFLYFAVDLIRARLKEALVLQTGKGNSPVSVKQDPRAALLIALREMMGGRTIVMAPDGRRGNPTDLVDLLDRQIPTAKGAALLAHEARCPTGWFNIVPRGGRLVPVIVPGPRVAPKERFNAFSERWMDFYWGQVGTFLRGDPRELSLLRRWSDLVRWDKPGRGTDRD